MKRNRKTSGKKKDCQRKRDESQSNRLISNNSQVQ